MTEKTYCTSPKCPFDYGCKRSYRNAELDTWTWCADLYQPQQEQPPKCYEPT